MDFKQYEQTFLTATSALDELGGTLNKLKNALYVQSQNVEMSDEQKEAIDLVKSSTDLSKISPEKAIKNITKALEILK